MKLFSSTLNRWRCPHVIKIFRGLWRKRIQVGQPSLLHLGLWPGPIWVGYRLNGSLKTGFTTNRFHSVSDSLENGPNRFETEQIFPKWAEKKRVWRCLCSPYLHLYLPVLYVNINFYNRPHFSIIFFLS